MTVTYEIEKITDALQEGIPILREHYIEIDGDEEVLEFDPDVEAYKYLEQNGVAKLMVAREDGKAIGYCIAFMSNSHQYKGLKIAQGDTYFVLPDKRGSFVGLMMLREMLNYLKSKGVMRVRFFSSVKCDTGPLLRWLGFKSTGMIYTLDM